MLEHDWVIPETTKEKMRKIFYRKFELLHKYNLVVVERIGTSDKTECDENCENCNLDGKYCI